MPASVFTHSVPVLSKQTDTYALASVKSDTYRARRSHPDSAARELTGFTSSPADMVPLTTPLQQDARNHTRAFCVNWARMNEGTQKIKAIGWDRRVALSTGTSQVDTLCVSGGFENCIGLAIGGEGTQAKCRVFHIHPQSYGYLEAVETYLKKLGGLKIRAALHGGMDRDSSRKCVDELTRLLADHQVEIAFNETCDARPAQDIANALEDIKGAPLGVYSPDGHKVAFVKEIRVPSADR